MTRTLRGRGLATTTFAIVFGGAQLCVAMQGQAAGTITSQEPLQGHILVDLSTGGHDARALFAIANDKFVSGKYRDARRYLRGVVIRFPTTSEAVEARKMLRRIVAILVKRTQRSSLGMTRDPNGPRKLGGSTIPVVTGWNIQVTKGPTPQDALALDAGDRVFFASGSVDLAENAERVVAAQAKWLREHPKFGLMITGHSDEPGSPADNIVLSVERAKAVRARLVAQGINPTRLRVAGFGNGKRVAVCAFAACLAQNRRVVAKVLRWSHRKGLHRFTSR